MEIYCFYGTDRTIGDLNTKRNILHVNLSALPDRTV